MTIAPFEPVTAPMLHAIHDEAKAFKRQVRSGEDPLGERNPDDPSEPSSIGITFKDAALDFIAENESGWKNAKHRQQWENTLKTYAFPIIGSKLIHTITTADVRDVLLQQYSRNEKTGTLWATARETASRIRSRIEIIIADAKASQHDDPATKQNWVGHTNPAVWRGNLQDIRAFRVKQLKRNFAAMDYADVPTFTKQLMAKSDYSARALCLTIMCAVRTNEAINATWNEFDLDNAVWTIPPERMKIGKLHRIPLAHQVLALLRSTPRVEGNPYVFVGAKENRPLSNMAMLEMLRGMRNSGLTVHGFRSSFRDWCSETTLHPDAVAEQALAHTISNKVESAYRRGDLFNRRKIIMQQWADYITMTNDDYVINWNSFIVQTM